MSVKPGFEPAPSPDRRPRGKEQRDRRCNHDDALECVCERDRPEAAERGVGGGKHGDRRHTPPCGRSPTAHDRQDKVERRGNDAEDHHAVESLDKRGHHASQEIEAGFEILGVGIHAGPVHGDGDPIGQQGPTGGDSDPIGHEVAHPNRIGASGIRDKIAGINDRGVQGEPDHPPRQRPAGQEPVDAGFRVSASQNPVENDPSVEGYDDGPIGEIHASLDLKSWNCGHHCD